MLSSLTTNGTVVKPRSILFDIFGSYVRYRGGVVGLSNLTQLLGWFGVSEDSVRVTLSRMRREKWFSSKRAGRASFYSLTPKGWELLDEWLQRIFEGILTHGMEIGTCSFTQSRKSTGLRVRSFERN